MGGKKARLGDLGASRLVTIQTERQVSNNDPLEGKNGGACYTIPYKLKSSKIITTFVNRKR